MRGRRAIRLKGHDYREPGSYFVTVRTRVRGSVLGDVVSGTVELNPVGTLAARCWQAIPEHHIGVKLGAYQIMPDHLHGIIVLGPPSRDVACNVPTRAIGEKGERGSFFSDISPKAGSLSVVIRSFKSAVTKEVHLVQPGVTGSLWQPGFYDHVIRDDVSNYFIERYISLNPLVWHLERKPGEYSGSLEEEVEKMAKEWQFLAD